MRVLIIGEDNHLPYLINSFLKLGHELTVIHHDRIFCKELARKFDTQIVHGDGTNPEILVDSGIERADIVIAMRSNDDENYLICEMTQEIFDVPKTLAVVNDPKNIEIFRKLGINNSIAFTEMITSFIEQKMDLNNITEIYTNEDDRVTVLEFDIEEGFPCIGKNIAELQLPKDAIISCILREDFALIPTPMTQIEVEDKMITYCLPHVEQNLIKTIKG